MTRASQSAKKARISVYKPKGTKHGSMVVLTPTRTWRGKITYKEVNAAPYYKPSDEGDKSLKKKPSMTSSHSRTAIPTSLEDTCQSEASCLDDQEPHIPRITKVRL